jgi:putative DNA primase/helicase
VSTPLQLVLDALESRQLNPRPRGDGYAARCPAHEDREPSLSLTEGDNGRVLLHCHAGCPFEEIIAALGLKAQDVTGQHVPTNRETRYEIRSTIGVLIATHVRLERPDGKKFHWECNGKPGLHGLSSKSLPLYGSETIRTTTGMVVLVEGEKAADALRRRGIMAVATVCGAATVPNPEVFACLQGRVVVLWPDRDNAGRLHMTHVGERLVGVAATVRVFEWDGAPEHGDAYDYFASGESVEALRDGLADAPPIAEWTPAVPAKAANQPEGQGRILELANPEPWGQPVDGATLAKDVADVLARFVVLALEAYVAVTLWILHSHALDAFQVSPLLLATSPTKRCGKTTLLHLMSRLVPRALMTSNISPASLFRAIERYKPTLLVDEADTFLKLSDEHRGLLNAGHTRAGAVVVRTAGEHFEPRMFSTWCAKVVAQIGRLPDTLEDRAVVVPMARRKAGEVVGRLRLDRLSELDPLSSRAARWAQDNVETLRLADPNVPQALDDRAQDNWRPLLAIADALGGDWPARARQAALSLAGVDSGTDDAGEVLLADLKAILAERCDPEQISSETLVSDLAKREDRPWPEWRDGKPITKTGLARLLRRFEIEPRSIRCSGDHVVRGYLSADMREAFARYLPANVLRPLHPASNAGPVTSPEVQLEPHVAHTEKGPEPHLQRGVAREAAGKGEEVSQGLSRTSLPGTGDGPVHDGARHEPDEGGWR